MIKLNFQVTAYTNFTETVKICGSIPELGQWDPQKAFELQTDPEKYPKWYSKTPICLPDGLEIEFKILILTQDNNLKKWEDLHMNRTYTTQILNENPLLIMEESNIEILEQNMTPIKQLNENKSYAQHLAPLRIQSYPIVSKIYENPENAIEYSYKCKITNSQNYLNDDNNRKQNRLKNELKQLSRQLPLSETNSIFLIYDEKRLDVMKALIFGSEGTPYAHGAFIFDIFIPEEYPNNPPIISITSTKGGQIRFNPNLYADGLVCLSLLGTWNGSSDENWNPQYSNIYQVLVSIQSLIMNEDVYFNEPSYEQYRESEYGNNLNKGYCNIVRYYNVQHTINDMIENSPKEFSDVIKKHFLIKKNKILKDIQMWVQEAQNDKTSDYDEIISYHNQQICDVFQENRNNYAMMLEQEMKRTQLLLNQLELNYNL